MSDQTAVQILLARLFKCSTTLSSAYYNSGIERRDDNRNDIDLLRQIRILSPSIRDTYQLRSSFRQFLNSALSTERLFAAGANIGGYFGRLQKLVAERAFALQDGRDGAAEDLEADIRVAISEIADAIDDELTILHAQVATKFAAVSTLAEKRRQNIHYQERTEKLVQLLEDFHFADLSDQLAGNEDLALSFRALFEDRLPAFRESLKAILQQLNTYLFEFRKIENRARSVRAFSLHLRKNPDWQAAAYDESADLPEWLQLASPISLHFSPDVSQAESETILREIAQSIPAFQQVQTQSRPPGRLDQDADSPSVVIVAPSPLKQAVRRYFDESAQSASWVSAREWWCRNPESVGSVREDVWLLRLLAEDERQGRARRWRFRLDATPQPHFDGNLIIKDVFATNLQA